MGNATWLLLALPAWFFDSLLHPFSLGALTILPALGGVCLLIGLGLGIKRRDFRLSVFLLPVLASEILVGISGFFRGKLESPTPWLYAFLAAQLVFVVFAVYRFKGSRIAAAALAVFCLGYAVEATFIAAMAFPDSWL